MFPNFFLPMVQAISNSGVITPDGGISANFILYLVIGLCTTLVSVIFAFILASINSIKGDVKEIKEYVHEFVAEQKGLNEKLLERTKHL